MSQDARSLVARLNRQAATLRERVILAPLAGDGRIRIRLDGLIHQFRVRERFSGWGHFRPVSEREAILADRAQPWERAAYLELFPLLRVILLWPRAGSGGAWWALPFNQSDARQRFNLSDDPLPVWLCDPTGGADRFEQALVRVDGRTLWYDGPDPLADPRHAEWLREASRAAEIPDRFPTGMPGSARLALLHHTARVAAEAARAQGMLEWSQNQSWRRRKLGPMDAGFDDNRGLEERLRRALAKADAVLHGFSEAPGRLGEPGELVVEWSERGGHSRYRSVLDRRLTVVSSGICLSGRDHDFDLTSLVSVIADR
ncbi:MAG TPA: hypothetical protein VN837_11365 [Chloroflexota bacterium]|nr:hypothetical protein [Chloroflexota bacterium]